MKQNKDTRVCLRIDGISFIIMQDSDHTLTFHCFIKTPLFLSNIIKPFPVYNTSAVDDFENIEAKIGENLY